MDRKIAACSWMQLYAHHCTTAMYYNFSRSTSTERLASNTWHFYIFKLYRMCHFLQWERILQTGVIMYSMCVSIWMVALSKAVSIYVLVTLLGFLVIIMNNIMLSPISPSTLSLQHLCNSHVPSTYCIPNCKSRLQRPTHELIKLGYTVWQLNIEDVVNSSSAVSCRLQSFPLFTQCAFSIQ